VASIEAQAARNDELGAQNGTLVARVEELERRAGRSSRSSSVPPRGIHSDARYTPAASPRVRRSPSSWPPHRRHERLGSCPPPSAGMRRHPRPDPPGSSWWAHLRGFKRLFLTYTFPSCLPDPDHLTVLTRPGVVGAAVHPSWRLPSQAAPSFASPLRRAGRGVLSPPHGPPAPRGAPYPDAIAGRGAPPGRTGACAGAAHARGARSAFARASRAAPACGSPPGPAGA
jgi:hypothetical protein